MKSRTIKTESLAGVHTHTHTHTHTISLIIVNNNINKDNIIIFGTYYDTG